MAGRSSRAARKAVADPDYGFDNGWITKFPAQRHHGDSDRVRKWIGRLVPDSLQQILGANDRTRHGSQHFEDSKLFARQTEIATGARGLAAVGIDPDIADLDDGQMNQTRAATQGLDTCDEFGHGEGLRQNIVGPDFQPTHAFIKVAGGGRASARAEAEGQRNSGAADVIAMYTGQLAIEHDDVICGHLQHLQGSFSVIGGVHSEPGLAQAARDDIGEGCLRLRPAKCASA